jgi:ABC-type transport system involved in cytochrome c biogenesis permease subunit
LAYPLTPELSWLWGGLACFGAGALAAWGGVWSRRMDSRLVLYFLLAAVALLGMAIAVRWSRTGEGPFLTLFEVLISNLFSLGLIYALAFWRVPLVRPGALLVLPVLFLLSVWTLTVSPERGRLPATYNSIWLWIHVGVGKLFLGTCLVAVGLAGTLLLRQAGRARILFEHLPAPAVLDVVAWRFMAIAFVFHSLMLIAGAVWAQDAWGRYWAWDPLETWAFVTWLALGISLHIRLTYSLPQWAGWSMILAVFVLAFLTFFGVPFSSLAPHKGIL